LNIKFTTLRTPTEVDNMQYTSETSPNRDAIYASNGHQAYDKYHFEEKTVHAHDIEYDEEEDEDIDQLIEDLESQNGDNADYEEEEAHQPGGARLIPEELLQTDTRTGLTSSEVLIRRKKYGENKMKGINCGSHLAPRLANIAQRKRRTIGSSFSYSSSAPSSS
jgi:magnesium-transporting ATPase (P-type)